MASDRRFELGLLLRVAGLVLAIAAVVATFARPGLGAVRIVAVVASISMVAALWHHVGRTNRELTRFIEAVRFGDVSQRFGGMAGGGFGAVGRALDDALRAVGDRQAGLVEEIRFLTAALDDAPIALFAIDEGGRVNLLSKAARTMFDAPAVTRLDDFRAYGPELAATLALPPGVRRLSRIVQDGIPQHVMVGSAPLNRLGRSTGIVFVMRVQDELGRVELAAQADLVRVLTHEIMNSLTPVTSLARSSADLVHAAQSGDFAALGDASVAATTVAERADGILRFVSSYRNFAATLEVRRRGFDARGWLDDVRRLAGADPQAGALAIAGDVDPDNAVVEGDPDLLAQVALNLLRNAALAGATRVELRLAVPRRGHGTLEVGDDGPGIPQDRREDVFLPFYTTRADGSGVGLSFARQVALAHGGSIAAATSRWGGARIRMSW